MQTETATTFQTVARELAAAFETAHRGNGSEFDRLRHDCPNWIVGNGADGGLPRLFHVAVDGDDPRPPCDYLYNIARRAADWIADSGYSTADDCRDNIGEFADGVADHSIPRLFYWLGDSGYNRALADEVFADSFDAGYLLSRGFENGAAFVIQAAQSLAAARVAECLVSAIETESASRDA